MRPSKKDLLPLSLLLTLPLLSFIYLWLNHPTNEIHSLVTDLDQKIPFIKIFIIPYISLQAFVAINLLYFYWRDRQTYYRTIITLNLSMVICFIIYYFFQTTVPRPPLNGGGMLNKLLRLTYSVDEPFNAFPSIHTMASFIMIKAIGQSNARNRWNSLIINTIAVLIIISTQLIKQHVLFDLVAGVVLGGLVFETVYDYKWQKKELWSGTLSVEKIDK